MNAAPHLYLAPLAGFTDAPFRLLCSGFGARRVYTEMASAAGLAHGSLPTMRLLETMPGEAPAVAQLFGNKEDDFAAAVRIVASLKRFIAVDLNTGCPMPRIRSEGSGSALLESPEKIHSLLVAMKAEAGDLPVTLKTRPGPRPDKVVMREIAAAAREAGVAEITMHARFASRAHGGPPLLDLLAEFVQIAGVPVIGNGGVADAATYAAMAQTGVAAVMVGRAALDRPDIFRVLAGEPGAETQRLSGFDLFRAHLGLMERFCGMLAEKYPDERIPGIDEYASQRFRAHLYRYFANMRGAAALRRAMNSFASKADVEAALATVFER